MKKETKREKVLSLIKDKIEKMGYLLVDIQIKRRWDGQELEVIISKPQGRISIKDCEKVSKKIDPILEGANLFENRWYLSVSSPGIDYDEKNSSCN